MKKLQKIKSYDSTDRKILKSLTLVKLIYLIALLVVYIIQYFVFKVNISLWEFIITIGVALLVNPIANLVIKFRHRGDKSFNS